MQPDNPSLWKRSVLVYLCCLHCIFVFACSEGSSSRQSNTGRIGFELNYLTVAPDHASATSHTPQALDCAASGVAKIEAILYDQDNREHRRGGPWDCDAESGTIPGIPPADNLKIVLLGRNADGLLVFRGEKSGIHVRAGQHTDAGSVDAVSIKPVLSISPDEPNRLAWNNSAGASYFTVHISENDQLDPLLVDESTTQPVYIPSGLIAGQTYHVRVIPWAYPDLEGMRSDTFTFTAMTAPALLAPADGAHHIVDDPLNFQWDGSPGADQYRIVISSTEDLSEPLINELVPTTTYTAANNFINTTYYWRVTARDVHGNEGARSSAHSVVLGHVPDAPIDVSTVPGNHSATIRWNGSATATSYSVYWSTSAGVTKTQYEGKFENITGTEYTHTNCTNKIPYYYIVTAKNSFGESAPTAEATCVPTPEWFITTGTPLADQGNGIAVDQDGNCYIAGTTQGDLNGEHNKGGRDAFVLKYDTNGNYIRTTLIGNSDDDQGNGIALDQSGNFYVTGYQGVGDEYDESGSFVAKYAFDGKKIWQERCQDPLEWIIGNAIAVDPNDNSYVTGFLGGSEPAIMILKYDRNGVNLIDNFSNPPDTFGGAQGQGIAADHQGEFYITGRADRLGTGIDVFVARYNTDGEEVYFGYQSTDNEEIGKDIAVDPDGNYYLTGYTYGTLGRDNQNTGDSDIFIMKYNPGNIPLWTKLLGSSAEDQGLGITVDHNGNSYVTGYTCGELEDGIPTSAGSCDAFIAKYDTNGNQLWVEVKGGDGFDSGRAIALDEEGNTVVTGKSGEDILIWKY